MGWIDVNDRMPPSGLEVLVEASGYITQSIVADHSFFIGCWIGNPDGGREPFWHLEYAYNEYKDHWASFDDPTVHAWMPLPKHYQPQENFTQDDDLMEHAMFEDDPEWLYKDDAVYTQMTIEEFLEGENNDRSNQETKSAAGCGGDQGT